MAAFFALGGRLADLVGPRRVLLIGTAVFAGASALCGAVPHGDSAQTWLIVFRAVQGFGAALMFPATLAVVVTVFPVERRGRARALFSRLSGALTAVGPILGGWLASWTWRAVFWVNLPVAVIAVVLTLLARIPGGGRPETLERRGAILIAAGMGLSVLGLQQASAWSWGSVATWACILGGLVGLVIFVGFGIASQRGGWILDRRGAKPTLRLGAALGAVGFALWAHKMTDLSLSTQWPYVVVAGAGIGLLLVPASTDAVNRAIGASYGEVTGVTQTIRNFVEGNRTVFYGMAAALAAAFVGAQLHQGTWVTPGPTPDAGRT